jgi:hypothetical protein
MGANGRDEPTFLDRYGLAGIDDVRSALGGGAASLWRRWKNRSREPRERTR